MYAAGLVEMREAPVEAFATETQQPQVPGPRMRSLPAEEDLLRDTREEKTLLSPLISSAPKNSPITHR